ncbi:GNAT family N-acetyltransferase [Exiguobacterium sp. RIT594]|uniref:GNAT family N-acetyltransferase n=1 Tax=Exiguobacterium sp. RIT594 TaxID=2282449 RepID=UPI000DF86AB8|nr:GNAT family N-acetyltransferase [Exiguobacterium sp. RIT594]RDB32424.1 GNAT family N-acetyltransferase [Exiguobacterium sp. RIT594]
MQIELRPVTNENWEACCALELTTEQQGFLEPNVYSIAQAGFEPTLVMRAIYAADELTGFLMYNSEREELDGYWIYRLMIDRRHQGSGIGRKAMRLLLEEMQQLPEATCIVVGYHPDNQATHRLYERLGFTNHGDRFGKEMAVRYTF